MKVTRVGPCGQIAHTQGSVKRPLPGAVKESVLCFWWLDGWGLYW